MKEKDLGITEVRGAKANIPDLQVYGDGDAFALLSKASSKDQGWMKSTKVCNVPSGCIVQVTTQQKNIDGSYAVAEALAFVPGVQIKKDVYPREFVGMDAMGVPTNVADEFWKEQQKRQEIITASINGIINKEKAAELLGY